MIVTLSTFIRLPRKDQHYIRVRMINQPVYSVNRTLMAAYHVKPTRRMRRYLTKQAEELQGWRRRLYYFEFGSGSPQTQDGTSVVQQEGQQADPEHVQPDGLDLPVIGRREH